MDNKIIEVLKKVENDQELSKALSECRDPEKAFELVGGSDSGITIDEFKSAMQELQHSCELTENDLMGVAGGMSENEKIIAGSVGIAVGVTASAASAAI